MFLQYISLLCLYITYGRAFVWIPCPSKCMFSHRHQCSACHRSREIGKIGYILEIQDGRHGDFEKIVNIGFWYQYILKFPKIYRFPKPFSFSVKYEVTICPSAIEPADAILFFDQFTTRGGNVALLSGLITFCIA